MRVRAVQLPTAEERARFPDAVPTSRPGSLASLSVPSDGLPMYLECNGATCRRAGTPAGALASGRGLPGMYAALQHEVAGEARLFDDETIGAVSEQPVSGRELTQPVPSAFGVVFQKPTEHHSWG